VLSKTVPTFLMFFFNVTFYVFCAVAPVMSNNIWKYEFINEYLDELCVTNRRTYLVFNAVSVTHNRKLNPDNTIRQTT